MDIERAMVARALQENALQTLIARGVSSQHFTMTDSGNEVRQVFEWSSVYFRQYSQAPSQQMVQQRFPNWRGEFAQDPLEALIIEFLRDVKRRAFDSKVIELSKMSQDRETWDHLDEIMLDAAREVATIVPAGRVAMFSADFQRQIEIYEDEKNKGPRKGWKMGIPILDEETMGIKPGWLVTNSGFSGMGKSHLTTYNCLEVFENDGVALLLSLEMSRQEVMERLHTMVMHWPHREYLRRELTDIKMQEWKDVARIYSKAKGEIIVVDKLSGATIDRIHAEIQRYKPDVVAIDYVQRMRASYQSKKPRHEVLEEITNELKSIAMETDTAVIMVSQDNRSAAETGSTATSGAQSISVFQAADLYLGMQQDEAMRAMNKMRIKCLKFRHGRNVEVDTVWDPATGDFGRIYQDADQFVKS